MKGYKPFEILCVLVCLIFEQELRNRKDSVPVTMAAIRDEDTRGGSEKKLNLVRY